MNRKNLLMILMVIVVGLIYVLVSKRERIDKEVVRPDFTVVLKDSIYIEYGVDVYNDDTLLNIIESNVIDELKSSIPSDALYEFEIDNSKPSFNYQERARALKWDVEGTEMFSGSISFGAITSFFYTAANKPGMDALTSKNDDYNLEKIDPYKGNFTITIGEYSEQFFFDYYVVDLSTE